MHIKNHVCIEFCKDIGCDGSCGRKGFDLHDVYQETLISKPYLSRGRSLREVTDLLDKNSQKDNEQRSDLFGDTSTH